LVPLQLILTDLSHSFSRIVIYSKVYLLYKYENGILTMIREITEISNPRVLTISLKKLIIRSESHFKSDFNWNSRSKTFNSHNNRRLLHGIRKFNI
jgi:hypothetical protein